VSPKLHFLCRRDELAPGEMRAFQVGRNELVLCRHGDEFAAVNNVCSHHGARLSEGVLSGTNVLSDVGEYCYGRDGEILRCPRHGYEYDILTGRSLHDPDHQRVKSYPIVVKEDEVFAELPG
jgi:3-phenylpropionate/trans-cinnamate dioxygenase ferredoxin subunit